MKQAVYCLAAFFGVTPGEVLGGLGSLMGGLFGALGAGFAVWLTLTLQRRDERTKISGVVQREVVEFIRIAMGHLETCENIHARKVTIPLGQFPLIMAMPKPTVYPVVADRLGRLRAGERLVTFFGGVSEIERAVAVIGAQIDRDPSWITPEDVKLIAENWIVLINGIGRLIVTGEIPEPGLNSTVRSEMLRQIDETVARARRSFAATEEAK